MAVRDRAPCETATTAPRALRNEGRDQEGLTLGADWADGEIIVLFRGGGCFILFCIQLNGPVYGHYCNFPRRPNKIESFFFGTCRTEVTKPLFNGRHMTPF